MIPDLMLPKGKKKIEAWAIDIHEAIDKYYSSYFTTQREKDFLNYNFFNGVIDKGQFEYVTDTHGNSNPARLVNYPVIKKMVELLVGEWVSSPMTFDVHLVNADAVNKKFDQKVNLIFDALIRPYRQELEKMAGIKLGEDTMGLEIPEHIEDFMNRNFRENTEDVVTNGISYLVHKYGLKDIFKRGLYDFAITAKQFYRVDIVNNDPLPRRIDPRNMIYDVHTDVDDLSKSEWVAEQRWMSVSEIVQEYRHDLKKEDISFLNDLRKKPESQYASAFTDAHHWFKFNDNMLSHVRVVTAEWKAIKTVKVKESHNKYNPTKPFFKFLSDDYKEKKNENIKKIEVIEVWEATRIGPDLYLRVKPSDFMVTREEWGYQETPLSYVGSIMHNIDGVTFSFVDLMKQIAILYDITMYNIELIMQRSAGKAVVYDVAQIPGGMEIDDVIYQAKNHGFIWINTAQEGSQLRNSFNQFASVDFTMSNSLTQLINLKMMLERTIETITGLNEARMGAGKSDAPVGTTEAQIGQSSKITQSFYHAHMQLLEKVMTRMTDLMKKAWAGRKKFNFPLGEVGAKWIELLASEDLSMNDYAIYIKNSIKDQRDKQTIVSLAEAALRGGQIGFLDLVKMVNVDSASDAQKILERSIRATEKANQEMQQKQMEMQQQAAQQQAQVQGEKNKILHGANQTRVQAARIAGEAKVRAEEVEQDGKRKYRDHDSVRTMDEQAFQQEVLGQEEQPGLIEMSQEKLANNE
jgi:hypothetical protein